MKDSTPMPNLMPNLTPNLAASALSTANAPAAAGAAKKGRANFSRSQSPLKEFFKRNGVWIAFLVLALAATLLTEGGFLLPRNLTNLMRQASINGVLAAGMTLVILHGGIDLSIGSLVAVAGIAVGVSQVTWGWSALGVQGALMSAGLAVGVGLLGGILNGGLVALLGIAPFVITLGMMVIARGLALIFSR